MIKLINRFAGEENCSHVSIQNLNSEEHRFMVAELYGKLVNTHADIPNEEIQNSGMFKAIVSGDRVFGEKKHRDPFAFHNRAKLVFSANDIPETTDETYAYFRRWVIESFNRYFIAGVNRNEDLIGELTTEEELSGLLNLALVGLDLLTRDKGFKDKSVEEIKAQYEYKATFVKQFLKEKCVMDIKNPKYYTIKSELNHEFIDKYCKDKGQSGMNLQDLEKELISVGIMPDRKTINKVKQYVYTGVVTLEEFDRLNKEALEKVKNSVSGNDPGQSTIG